MKSMIPVTAAVLVATCLGCAHVGTKPSADTPSFYEQGVLTEIYDADIPKTYEASVKAMTDPAMTIKSSDKDSAGEVILATSRIM